MPIYSTVTNAAAAAAAASSTDPKPTTTSSFQGMRVALLASNSARWLSCAGAVSAAALVTIHLR